MAEITKTVVVCDATGSEVSSPVRVGLSLDGKDIKLDMHPRLVSKFVLSLAQHAGPEALARTLDEVFGPKWRSADDILVGDVGLSVAHTRASHGQGG